MANLKNHNVLSESKVPLSNQLEATPVNGEADGNRCATYLEWAELDKAFKESSAKVDRSFEELMKVAKMCMDKMN